MKKLLVYSTLTGNTRIIADAINDVICADIFSIDEATSVDDYDVIFLGFWVDKGHADDKMLNFFQCVRGKGKKVAIFYTLGAYPDSKHADDVFSDTVGRLKGNDILGHFKCQGKVDPGLIEMMSRFPKTHPHSMTPERVARIEEASKHPNQTDIENAKKFAAEISGRI